MSPIRLNFDGLGRDRNYLDIRYRNFGDIFVGARPKIGYGPLRILWRYAPTAL
jgi:hypothetical protein